MERDDTELFYDDRFGHPVVPIVVPKKRPDHPLLRGGAIVMTLSGFRQTKPSTEKATKPEKKHDSDPEESSISSEPEKEDLSQDHDQSPFAGRHTP